MFKGSTSESIGVIRCCSSKPKTLNTKRIYEIYEGPMAEKQRDPKTEFMYIYIRRLLLHKLISLAASLKLCSHKLSPLQ